MTAAQTGPAQQAMGAQLRGGDYAEFMNPYMNSVIDSTINTMGRERDRAASSIGARAAASGSFGGSREAIQRGQLDKNFGEQVGNTVALLMAQGFDKATAQAMANTQLRQQTDLTNTQFRQQSDLSNADRAQQAAAANSQFAQQMGLANMAAANQMQTAGANYGLQATQLNDGLRTNQQAREMSILNQLLAQGGAQQQQMQRALDVPRTAIERLNALTPKQLNQQTVTTKTKEDEGSGLSSILGGISSGLGLLKGVQGLGGVAGIAGTLGLGSDEREKTDVQKFGKPKDGEPQMYAYRYRGDPKTYPKVVGPMAADVEREYPGSTADVDGRKAVEPNLLLALMGKARKAA
jgi:hypothetical protein